MTNKENKKYVIIFNGEFPPPEGGVGTWNTNISALLVKEGYSVYSLRGGGITPKGVKTLCLSSESRFIRLLKYLWDMITVLISKRIVIRYLFRNKILYLKDLKDILGLLIESKRFVKFIKGKFEKYIIYASHCSVDEGLFGAFLKQSLGGSRLIIHEHGSGLEYSDINPCLMPYLEKQTDIFLVASEFMKKRLLEKGIFKDKITVIPNGIVIKPETGMLNKEKLILFCGSLEKHKDPLSFIKSIPLVINKYPEYKFVLVGSGNMKHELQRYVAENGLDYHVEFTGPLEHEVAIEYFKRAKIFVLPSLREPFGIVILEALINYTPCIVSNIGGMPEIIRNTAGKIVPPEQPVDISEAIICLLSDNQKWNEYASIGYQRVKAKYDLENIFQQFANIIKCEDTN